MVAFSRRGRKGRREEVEKHLCPSVSAEGSFRVFSGKTAKGNPVWERRSADGRGKAPPCRRSVGARGRLNGRGLLDGRPARPSAAFPVCSWSVLRLAHAAALPCASRRSMVRTTGGWDAQETVLSCGDLQGWWPGAFLPSFFPVIFLSAFADPLDLTIFHFPRRPLAE